MFALPAAGRPRKINDSSRKSDVFPAVYESAARNFICC
jgi:hypothetical protein